MAYVRSNTFDDQSNVADASFRPRAYPPSKARLLRGQGPQPVPVSSINRPGIIRAANLTFASNATSDLRDQSKLVLAHPRKLVATPTRVFPHGPPGHPARPIVSVPRLLPPGPAGHAFQAPDLAKVHFQLKPAAAAVVKGKRPLKMTKTRQGLHGLGQDSTPPGFDAAGNYIGPVVAPTPAPMPGIPAVAPQFGGSVPVEPTTLATAQFFASAAEQAQGASLQNLVPYFGAGVAVPKVAPKVTTFPISIAAGRTAPPVVAAPAATLGAGIPATISGIPTVYLLGFAGLVAIVLVAKKKR